MKDWLYRSIVRAYHSTRASRHLLGGFVGLFVWMIWCSAIYDRLKLFPIATEHDVATIFVSLGIGTILFGWLALVGVFWNWEKHGGPPR